MERRYLEMKHTYNTILMANTNLVDDLKDLKNKINDIKELSKGNQQKIQFITSILHEPKLLILDEPFNFLDPSSQSIIKHILKDYNQQTGATILVSSHNLEHTVDVCPRIALMEHGKIIRDIDNKEYSAKQELEEYFNVTT